jgi:hypothetical protein
MGDNAAERCPCGVRCHSACSSDGWLVPAFYVGVGGVGFLASTVDNATKDNTTNAAVYGAFFALCALVLGLILVPWCVVRRCFYVPRPYVRRRRGGPTSDLQAAAAAESRHRESERRAAELSDVRRQKWEKMWSTLLGKAEGSPEPSFPVVVTSPASAASAAVQT